MERDGADAATVLQGLATRLLRLARSAHGKHGLGSAQYSALAVLYERGPLPVVELARLERVSHPTISRVVAGLVKLNAVQKRPAPNDRRSKLIELTPEGAALYERVCANRVALTTAILSQLKPETVEEITTVMKRVAGAMEAPKEP